MNPSASFVDQPRSVREGEQLDAARLLSYLHERMPDVGSQIEIEQFPSGFSNLTYLLRIDDKQYVLRRPPFGAKIKTAHDMGREFHILSALYPIYKKVPRPVLYCDDEQILGAPFYLMERVNGVILRAQPPAGFSMSPEIAHQLSRSFIETLVEIHAIDHQTAGLGQLGRPEGYVTRQIEGWTRRYYNARTDHVPEIEALASWLATHTPRDSGSALIHNDYKYDNAVLATDDLTRIVAVLDWEMATVGDPLMDFGTSLAYWVDADDLEEWKRLGFGLTAAPGSLSRSEVVEYYARRRGRDVENVVFYFAYGLLKVAGIVQQIYNRYKKGFTRDPRFSDLGRLVRACGVLANRAIEKQRIDKLG